MFGKSMSGNSKVNLTQGRGTMSGSFTHKVGTTPTPLHLSSLLLSDYLLLNTLNSKYDTKNYLRNIEVITIKVLLK